MGHIPCVIVIGLPSLLKRGGCQRVTYALPGSYICMRPIRPLPLDYQRTKSAPHYCDYQLLGHCISFQDYFNKGTHVSVNLDQLLVSFSPYPIDYA